jgi:L-threonylcarbamoyladenylate synthase
MVSRGQGIVSLLDPDLQGRVTEVIRRGELVIFPTETIYGIGGSAWDGRAWDLLRRIKPDRSAPFTYLAADWGMAEVLIGEEVARIRKVADRVWPGPVTLIVTASKHIESKYLAPDRSVGIRIPAIDRIRDAITASGVPWVHTSANLTGGKGVRRVRQLDPIVRSYAKLIIDGGATALGGESTILDIRCDPIKVCRSGIMSEGQLREILTLRDEC